MTHVPPSPNPNFQRLYEDLARRVEALERRRLDFPSTEPDPDCYGCLCQSLHVGSGSGLALTTTHVQTTYLSTIAIDCPQAGGIIRQVGSNSPETTAPSVWYCSARVEFDHTGTGLSSARVLIQDDAAQTIAAMRVPGTVEASGGLLEINVGGMAVFYPGDGPRVLFSALAGSGTYSVTVTLRCTVMYQFLYDGF